MTAQPRTVTGLAGFRAVGAQLSNWGRWGEDDERGTVNLITPERLAAAAGTVRRGAVFSLAIPLGGDGPQTGELRDNPIHLMAHTGAEQVFPGGFRYADDYLFMCLQSSTQWDSLAHCYYDGLLYNGFRAEELNVRGAVHCSIDTQRAGIAGRGVLLDIAGLHGQDWLEAGTVITPDDLDEACRVQGVSVEPGDVVLVRTGWRTRFVRDRDANAFMAGEPGLGLACCEWLHRHDVSAVGSDNWAIEVLPSESEELLAVHMVLIRDMGVSLCELLDLDALTADCRADGRWSFFFVAPPLAITRGVGSPVNPLAIK